MHEYHVIILDLLLAFHYSCTLSESRISVIGDEEEVHQEMGHLQYLDLKSNLLSNWHEIAILSRALPNLEALLLGGNRLGPAPMSLANDIMAMPFGRNGFSQLLSLELSGVRLSSWSQVSCYYCIDDLPTHTTTYQLLWVMCDEIRCKTWSGLYHALKS